MKPMNFCEFVKCHYGEAHFDLGGCSTAWSGETCYTLYSDEKEPFPKFTAYEIHLEEVRLNNEWRKGKDTRDDLRSIC